MIRAAGILIVSDKGNALFLTRGPGGDMPGLWSFTVRRVEAGEVALQTAIRETRGAAGSTAVPNALGPRPATTSQGRPRHA